MPIILFYFDFSSPCAYIAFHQLPQVLADLAWQIQYRPVRQTILCNQSDEAASHADAASIAAQQGLPFQWPARTTFQTEPWLHMALAADPYGQPGRQVCETLFHAIWQHGHDPDDWAVQQQAWQDATALLPSVRDVHDPQVRQEVMQESMRRLLAHEQAARAHGVHQLPCCTLLPADGGSDSPQNFLGLHDLPLLREAVGARQVFATKV
jgi:2-hydroxychromene-2-carboxylate isomerase